MYLETYMCVHIYAWKITVINAKQAINLKDSKKKVICEGLKGERRRETMSWHHNLKNNKKKPSRTTNILSIN